jgi:hypothetical protein
MPVKKLRQVLADFVAAVYTNYKQLTKGCVLLSSESRKYWGLEQPYFIMMCFCVAFIIFGFLVDTPGEIFSGLRRILLSRSILITDYIAVGGIGATMLNASLACIASIVMLASTKVSPNGATIMALWMTLGFAFFGKNLFNMIPLTIGVWLYAKYKKEPFSNYSLNAMLVATVSPVVSEISFLGILSPPVEMTIGIFMGFFIGFIFPPISAFTVRLHGGYNLYNMGFAGGLICMFLSSVMRNMGLDVTPVNNESTGNNLVLGALLYAVSAALVVLGLALGNARENIRELWAIHKRSGRLVSDFYLEQGNAIYLNAGLLCAFSTSVVLILGAEINGPSIAGILTITGFASFGKHLRNVAPLVIGATVCAYFNRWDLALSDNILTILFATGLAPIAGQFGWVWGIVAGLLHVNITMYTGHLAGGLNLYANGWAAGFAVMFLLPLITAFGKDRKQYEN